MLNTLRTKGTRTGTELNEEHGFFMQTHFVLIRLSEGIGKFFVMLWLAGFGDGGGTRQKIVRALTPKFFRLGDVKAYPNISITYFISISITLLPNPNTVQVCDEEQPVAITLKFHT